MTSARSIADAIIRRVACDNDLRILLAGPCGIGKTRIAKEIVSRYPDVKHIEHDELKLNGGSRCGPSDFDPDSCFSPCLRTCPSGFVIDLGGDTVFRPRANNDDRLRRMKAFKEEHAVTIILLTAEHGVLLNRFLYSKDRTAAEFKEVWHNWRSIEEPYWRKCIDLEIDTS